MKDREHNGQKFEDSKGLIRRHKSMKDREHNGQRKKDKQHNGQKKKDRQHNGQKKKDNIKNNDQQNIIHKLVLSVKTTKR
jgi:hypothetical protein